MACEIGFPTIPDSALNLLFLLHDRVVIRPVGQMTARVMTSNALCHYDR